MNIARETEQNFIFMGYHGRKGIKEYLNKYMFLIYLEMLLFWERLSTIQFINLKFLQLSLKRFTEEKSWYL